MWERYSHDYDLNAQVVSMGMLTEGEDGENFLLDNDIYAERDFLLIDESHNLRNVGTQRYRLVSDYMAGDPNRRCCLLTATPRNEPHGMSSTRSNSSIQQIRRICRLTRRTCDVSLP